MSAIDDLIHEGPVPIDGGFATELEALDYDLTSDLWSARLLQDGPAAVEAVHLNFLRAGARVSITASYQASQESFATAGIPAAEADRLIATSVTLAQAARTAFEAEHPAAPFTLVAASRGPYGARLANGQEYTGDYEGAGVDAIAAFHRPRVAALLGAGPDVLAWETIPNLLEADAIARLQAELPEPPLSRRQRYVKDFGLAEVDAENLTAERDDCFYFEACVQAAGGGAKAGFAIGKLLRNTGAKWANERGTAIAALGVKPERVAELFALREANAVGPQAADQLFGLLCDVAFHNFLYGLLPVCLQGFGIYDQSHVIFARYLSE